MPERPPTVPSLARWQESPYHHNWEYGEHALREGKNAPQGRWVQWESKAADGRKTGVRRWWDTAGVLREEIRFEAGLGHRRVYYEDGRLEIEGAIDDAARGVSVIGPPTGTWCFHDRKGRLIVQCDFTHRKFLYDLLDERFPSMREQAVAWTVCERLPSLPAIDGVPWHALEAAYGNAETIGLPLLLRGAALCREAPVREHILDLLYNNVCHQGSVYPATREAVRLLTVLLDERLVVDGPALRQFVNRSGLWRFVPKAKRAELALAIRRKAVNR